MHHTWYNITTMYFNARYIYSILSDLKIISNVREAYVKKQELQI